MLHLIALPHPHTFWLFTVFLHNLDHLFIIMSRVHFIKSADCCLSVNINLLRGYCGLLQMYQMTFDCLLQAVSLVCQFKNAPQAKDVVLHFFNKCDLQQFHPNNNNNINMISLSYHYIQATGSAMGKPISADLCFKDHIPFIFPPF